MRVILLLDSSGVGGIERHVEVLARALSQRGVECEIALYADHGPHPWIAQLRAANLPFCTLAGHPLAILAKLRERPCLLHTHGYKAGIIGRIFGALAATPVVSTYHAGERGPWPVGLYQMIDELTAPLAASICVNEKIAAKVRGASSVIPNFIEAPNAPPQGPLPNRIAFVGRLSPEKGPEVFCELADRIGDTHEWIVVGDGPMRAALEARHGTRVRFMGVVTEMDSIWRRIGLLVISSWAEGLPLAALEAFAAGVPIAATRVGSLPDVVAQGETGWLAAPGDLDGLADAVTQWSRLNADRAEEMRHACWRTVRERYDINGCVEDILRVYRSAGWRD